MKRRDLGFGRRVYVCLLLCLDGLEEVKQPIGKKVVKNVLRLNNVDSGLT